MMAPEQDFGNPFDQKSLMIFVNFAELHFTQQMLYQFYKSKEDPDNFDLAPATSWWVLTSTCAEPHTDECNPVQI
ncbi:MAG: hypothetical protein ACT6Q8_05435 [Niveispirillum sp.]|uniref:hypothetical protein n=1 Tax=Niveispirillum sp. TaxID=1917217 RepID=UPI0012E2A3D2